MPPSGGMGNSSQKMMRENVMRKVGKTNMIMKSGISKTGVCKFNVLHKCCAKLQACTLGQ